MISYRSFEGLVSHICTGVHAGLTARPDGTTDQDVYEQWRKLATARIETLKQSSGLMFAGKRLNRNVPLYLLC